jgi:cardiolipin synthase
MTDKAGDAVRSARLRDDRRWLTVPNVISIGRLVVFAPIFVILLVVVDSPLWALIVVVILGCTDWIDGWVARRFHQVTTLGKALDPIADRISQIVVAGTMVIVGLLPLWFAVAVVVVDVVLGVTILIRKPGVLPVRWIGRIRTALLMIGLPAVLAVAALAPSNQLLRALALGIVGLGVVLHVMADLVYIWGLITGTAHQHPDAHPDVT